MNLYDCHILLVDDEKKLCEMVKTLLVKNGFIRVDMAQNVSQADLLFANHAYHLVLLDVMLPDGDGFSLLRSWKKRDPELSVPVIFLSARDEDRSRLRGLGLGADDYITKPFLPEELLLRVKAVLKRTWNLREKSEGVLILGPARVSFDEGIIRIGERENVLTAKEFLLLQKLYENRGKIVSVNTLMDTLWPDGSFGYENSLMVHIRRLREKLEENPSKPEWLLTVRGLGYKLKR